MHNPTKHENLFFFLFFFLPNLLPLMLILQFSYSSICHTSWEFANAFATHFAELHGHVSQHVSPRSTFVARTYVSSLNRSREHVEGKEETLKRSYQLVLVKKIMKKVFHYNNLRTLRIEDLYLIEEGTINKSI